MSKKNVYFPTELISEIYIIVQREGYESLEEVFFGYIKGDTEYLSLEKNDASNILKLADIEMQRAILKYPHNEDDDPNFNPEHEKKYDDVMMGIYEKTHYYIQSEFSELGG